MVKLVLNLLLKLKLKGRSINVKSDDDVPTDSAAEDSVPNMCANLITKKKQFPNIVIKNDSIYKGKASKVQA